MWFQRLSRGGLFPQNNVILQDIEPVSRDSSNVQKQKTVEKVFDEAKIVVGQSSITIEKNCTDQILISRN